MKANTIVLAGDKKERKKYFTPANIKRKTGHLKKQFVEIKERSIRKDNKENIYIYKIITEYRKQKPCTQK